MGRRDLVDELEGNFQKFRKGNFRSEFNSYNSNDDEGTRRKKESARKGQSVFKIKGGLS